MDTQAFLESLGYIGIFLSVFIESGVPLGLVLPLPGWTLLFTGGVLAVNGNLDIKTVLVVGVIAAVLGYIVGYYTGYKYGRKLFFEKNTKRFFTKSQGVKTEKFMKKYGYSTLIIGRFLPIIHNLAPILSGVAKMPFLPFMIVNAIGAVLWVFSGVFLGYFIGERLPSAHYYLIPLIILFTILINTRYAREKLTKIYNKIDV